MKLSLRLSFYLRRNLEGYMVGTTSGFPIETVEATSPQGLHGGPHALTVESNGSARSNILVPVLRTVE
jgi:hypothetical protein